MGAASPGGRMSGAASGRRTLYVASPQQSPRPSSGPAPAGPSGHFHEQQDLELMSPCAQPLPGCTEAWMDPSPFSGSSLGQAASSGSILGQAARSGSSFGQAAGSGRLSESFHMPRIEDYPDSTPAAGGEGADLQVPMSGTPYSLARSSFSGGTPSVHSQEVGASSSHALPGGVPLGPDAQPTGVRADTVGQDSERLHARQLNQMQQGMLHMQHDMTFVEQQEQEVQQQLPQAPLSLHLLPERGKEVSEAQWRKCCEELQALERQISEARLQAEQQLQWHQARSSNMVGHQGEPMSAAMGGGEPAWPPARHGASSRGRGQSVTGHDVAQVDNALWLSPAQERAHEPHSSVAGPDTASLDSSSPISSATLAEQRGELRSKLRTASLPTEDGSRRSGSARRESQMVKKSSSASLQNRRTSRTLEPGSRPRRQVSNVTPRNQGSVAEAQSGGGAAWSLSLLGKKISSFTS